jgi:hypothetical protein
MGRTRIWVTAAASCLLLWPAGVARAQEEKPAVPEEAAWKVEKVVESARPETVTLKPIQWPPLSVSHEKAPEGQGWLVVVVQLKPPEPEAKLNVSSVRLLDNSSSEHGVFALAYYKEPWTFESVADFPAGVSSATDQATWGKDREETDLQLAINEGKEGLVALLFLVPLEARGFRLRVEGAPAVDVPLEKSPAPGESSPH